MQNISRFRQIAITMSGYLAILNFVVLSVANTQANEIDVWIGTSSAKPSKGIYHCTLNTENGRLSDPTLAAEVRGPGFLAMHPNGTHLYAVGALNGKPSLIAYDIRNESGKSQLEFANSLEIGDGGAAHVSIDPTAKTILTAQYGGGSVAVFSVNENGSLGRRTQIVEHEGGTGIFGSRQNSPHPHWTGFSPDNRFAFVPDLGLDNVMIYKVDVENSNIESHGFGQGVPGGGPRHMKFHPGGKWIYQLNELSLSVTVFDYDSSNGTMTPKQTLNTVPKEQLIKDVFKSASEIRVHPNGRFVYSANRGHDTITAFRVNSETGELTVIEREHIRGATPRNFNIDPSGRWLLAAGQHSHTLAAFEIDQDTGELRYNQSIVHAPSAICVLFEHE